MDEQRRAVVCDDDPMIVMVASMLLQREGFGVTAVGTGAELADVLMPNPPTLVILDHELPDATGDELVRVIEAAAPACRVILFSGRETPDAAGVNVFARVPKRGTEELAAAIRRAAGDDPA